MKRVFTSLFTAVMVLFFTSHINTQLDIPEDVVNTSYVVQDTK